MHSYTTAELQKARGPIASLIGKSEKALQKLAPETWQHRMLQENLAALRSASALMERNSHEAGAFTRQVLQAALVALASMISRNEKAQRQFTPGSSQHTLQRNRLEALRLAEAVVAAERDTA